MRVLSDSLRCCLIAIMRLLTDLLPAKDADRPAPALGLAAMPDRRHVAAMVEDFLAPHVHPADAARMERAVEPGQPTLAVALHLLAFSPDLRLTLLIRGALRHLLSPPGRRLTARSRASWYTRCDIPQLEDRKSERGS